MISISLAIEAGREILLRWLLKTDGRDDLGVGWLMLWERNATYIDYLPSFSVGSYFIGSLILLLRWVLLYFSLESL